MATYESYTHIERLGKADTNGILDRDEVYISAKMDGSNGCIFNENGVIECGSRNRQLAPDKDNGGFYQWVNSDNEEAVAIREFLLKYPEYRIYGEWMGYTKFLGSIKTYNKEALNRFFIFDVYHVYANEYLPDNIWRNMLLSQGIKEEWMTKLYGVYNHPTLEQVEEIAQNNRFMLDNSNVPGEGVVIKSPGFKNCYGRECYGKFVLDDFKARKAEKKSRTDLANVEESIVATYLSDAELAKNMAKTCVWASVDEFDKKNGKMIGFFLNMCFQESILEECGDWVKRFKNPIVDFGKLRNLSNVKARIYLGF